MLKGTHDATKVLSENCRHSDLVLTRLTGALPLVSGQNASPQSSESTQFSLFLLTSALRAAQQEYLWSNRLFGQCWQKATASRRLLKVLCVHMTKCM